MTLSAEFAIIPLFSSCKLAFCMGSVIYSSNPSRNMTNQILRTLLWAYNLPVWHSRGSCSADVLIHIFIDAGDGSLEPLYRYSTIYYRTPPHHQYLGYSC